MDRTARRRSSSRRLLHPTEILKGHHWSRCVQSMSRRANIRPLPGSSPPVGPELLVLAQHLLDFFLQPLIRVLLVALLRNNVISLQIPLSSLLLMLKEQLPPLMLHFLDSLVELGVLDLDRLLFRLVLFCHLGSLV
jgi:hypothetical protein